MVSHEVTFTEYFDYVHHDPTMPRLAGGRDPGAHRVLIAGGGPTGLAVAIGLARFGVPSVVLEADDSVCSGSRAGAITRRTLEIFERLGVIEDVLAKGYPWGTGITYLGDREVLRFEMPDDQDQKYPPGMSLQQNYVEQYLLAEIAKYPDLIEVRWQSSVTDTTPEDGGVDVGVRTPDGSYRMRADWLVACDGGQSTVRRNLGLRMAGTSYEGRYVIIDIRIDTEGMSPGRRCWFDPPSNPGSTLLMYAKPDQMVRLDYQLGDDEDEDEAAKPENVLPRVEQHLKMLGLDRPWEPVWLSLYKANAVTLERYRHGRVLFAGEAAHLIPIFGVRGMNSSLDDAHNLAWKLALVAAGAAGDALLDSYSEERVYAARENLRLACRGAEFMAPPSAPFRLLRDAVLSLVGTHPWINTLLNPRQHSAIPLTASPLNMADEALEGFGAGPAPGDILTECPLTVYEHGREVATYLTSLLGPHVTALYFTGADGAHAPLPEPAGGPVPCKVIEIRGQGGTEGVVDTTGRLFPMYGARPGTLYVVRPDGHVLGRRHDADANVLARALARIGSRS